MTGAEFWALFAAGVLVLAAAVVVLVHLEAEAERRERRERLYAGRMDATGPFYVGVARWDADAPLTDTERAAFDDIAARLEDA